MNLFQHGTTSILTYDKIENWTTRLVTQCLNFYPEATKNIKIVIFKEFSRNNNVGLALPDIEGFIIYWDTMLSMAEKHAKKGINPMATLTHLIADTVFHESHHVDSYYKDYEWTINNQKQEETDAEEISNKLCVEFFKEIPIEVPMGDLPYIYKNGVDIITDLREYFNILLDSDKKWEHLDVKLITKPSLSPTATTELKNSNPKRTIVYDIDPLAEKQPQQPTPITPQQAKNLYITCFNNIFGGCGPSSTGFNTPERILDPIQIPPIVKSTLMMGYDGNTKVIENPETLSGLIFKVSKLPAYDFILIDGKKRCVVPQNPQKRNNKGVFTKAALQAQAGEKIGYVIDKTSNKLLLRYENGVLIPY